MLKIKEQEKKLNYKEAFAFALVYGSADSTKLKDDVLSLFFNSKENEDKALNELTSIGLVAERLVAERI